MRLDRISLQLADGEVRTFEFHRGLTVVEAEAGGEGALARALLGTLSSAGDGVHVELTLDDDTGLVVFRPFGGAHRVIDVDTSADRTEGYAQPGGRVDVLAPYRSGDRHPARDLVVSGDDVRDGDPTDAWIARLAGADPAAVLRAAEEEVAAERELRHASTAARQRAGGAPAEARSPRARTAGASAAERRYRVLLPTTAVVGSGLAIGGAAAADSIGTGGALAMIGGALALVAGTVVYGRKVDRDARRGDSRAAPTDAPAATGGEAGVPPATAGERAEGEGDGERSLALALADAAERYQAASQVWGELAGSIPAPWALSERARIERTAQLRTQVTPSEPGVEPLAAAPQAAAVIAGLTVRMASSHAGPGAETLPLFLDDPLEGLSWADKAPVLEFLGRLATEHQLVLVTADPEVLAWARLEAMAGAVGAITAAAESSSGAGGATATSSA